MLKPVAAFLRGQITYERLYSDLLETRGGCLSLQETRAVLGRIGVKPGCFVWSDKGSPSDSCSGYVFFVRAITQSSYFVVLLTARSYPLSVRSATQSDRYVEGVHAGVFFYFRPKHFEVIARVNPALVRLAVTAGTYDTLARMVAQRINRVRYGSREDFFERLCLI